MENCYQEEMEAVIFELWPSPGAPFREYTLNIKHPNQPFHPFSIHAENGKKAKCLLSIFYIPLPSTEAS